MQYRIMRERRDFKLAVLIDADNIPYGYIKGMLSEIAKIGVPTIKRIYGDWTKPTVAGWKTASLEHAITPVQQYSYTIGKNATDSAMIIDAMDILHQRVVDGFCIISSDSDFTRLATRLRESGMLVVGIGEKKTPMPFIVSCDKFLYIEILGNSEEDENDPQLSYLRNAEHTSPIVFDSIDDDTMSLLMHTVRDVADDNGWAFLGDVGNLLLKNKSDFDPRNFGFPKLTPLIKSMTSVFEIDQRQVNDQIRHIYIRLIEDKQSV